MIKIVHALRGLPTLWVGPRFPYMWEIPCPAGAGLQGSSIRGEIRGKMGSMEQINPMDITNPRRACLLLSDDARDEITARA